MAEIERNTWGIHTQNDNLFLHSNKIAIGWCEMGDLKDIEASREGFKKKYFDVYPNVKKGSVPTSAGML